MFAEPVIVICAGQVPQDELEQSGNCALVKLTIMARKMMRASRGTDPTRPAKPRRAESWHDKDAAREPIVRSYCCCSPTLVQVLNSSPHERSCLDSTRHSREGFCHVSSESLFHFTALQSSTINRIRQRNSIIHSDVMQVSYLLCMPRPIIDVGIDSDQHFCCP